MVSILICSYSESKYLGSCLSSLAQTLEFYDYEILVDCESSKSGLVNTPKRYQHLYSRISPDTEYVVKSDDDIQYFDGWLKNCLNVLQTDERVGYVCPLNHLILRSMGHADMHTDKPVIQCQHNLSGHILQPFVSGACWVFNRDLWEKVPYGNLNGIRTLDSNYGASVRAAGLHPAYLSDVLCSHLGITRHGGVDVA